MMAKKRMEFARNARPTSKSDALLLAAQAFVLSVVAIAAAILVDDCSGKESRAMG